jgi:peptide chain release factor 2
MLLLCSCRKYGQSSQKRGIHFDLASLRERLKEYHAELEDPQLWNEPEKAQNVNRGLRITEDKINKYEKLVARADDIEVLIELGQTEEDDSIIEEVLGELNDLQKNAESLQLETLLSGPYDANNAILSLHAGAGGTEAQDWTQMLYRMYTRWCERKGYQLKLLDYLEGDEAGIKSVAFSIEGLHAYGYLKAEKGVHRLVRISPFDASSRRHTSFTSLDVVPEIDDAPDIVIRPEDLRIDTYRSSGAGGQHVNKTDSAVRITHIPTGIVVSCQTERSQIQNRETCMRMLMSHLVERQEEERMQEMNQIQGELKKIEWGSQIRSYVFHPYSMVKDHRTGAETANVNGVMDGDLDPFIFEYLKKM